MESFSSSESVFSERENELYSLMNIPHPEKYMDYYYHEMCDCLSCIKHIMYNEPLSDTVNFNPKEIPLSRLYHYLKNVLMIWNLALSISTSKNDDTQDDGYTLLYLLSSTPTDFSDKDIETLLSRIVHTNKE